MGTRPPAYTNLLREHGAYIICHPNSFECIACSKVISTIENPTTSLKQHIEKSTKHEGIIAEYNEMISRGEEISGDFREPRLSYSKKKILKNQR